MRYSTTRSAPAVSSDASLLAAARRDPAAFGELYERYAEAVNEYFVRRTRSRATAFDLTAETFAQVWFVRTRFRDEAGGSAAPWIYGIARNVLLMSIRRGAIERRATERLGLQEHLDRPQCVEDAVPEGTWAEGADELLDTRPRLAHHSTARARRGGVHQLVQPRPPARIPRRYSTRRVRDARLPEHGYDPSGVVSALRFRASTLTITQNL
jgi:RNA polymerase sigma-70 factor (ECF subfamily)